ncbi:MAG: outer membrane protein [Hyphomicrobiaceae bacterium]
MYIRGSVTALALASSIAAISITPPAEAADLWGAREAGSIKDAPYVAPFSWTGFYVGANAGYAWGDSDYKYSQTGDYLSYDPLDLAFAHALGSGSFSDGTFTGGAQAGYNVQTNGIVFGVETDINSFRLSDTQSSGPSPLPVRGAMVSSAEKFSTDYLFTLRGRLGVAADRTLFYVTGGLAVSELKFSQTFTHLASGTVESGSVSDVKAGWTVGGGIEYAFTSNWTAKVEYLYVDLGSVGFSTKNSGFPSFGAHHEADLTAQIARVGINYKF